MSSASFTFGINTAIATTIAISLIGNLTSIIIFSRKTFRNNSISTYCLALSINELFSSFRFVMSISNIAFNVNIADQSDALCKVFNYIPAVYSAVQPSLLVVFSIDKLLNMRTSSIAILKKKWFQWSIVASIVIFNLLLFLEIPILMKSREVAPGRVICDQTTIGFLNVLVIVVDLETCLIPFILMILSSILTIRLLIKSRNSFARNGNVSKDRKSRDKKYAVSSVAFNIMFLVFKSPYMIYYTLLAFYSYYNPIFFNTTVFLMYLNSASFFFIHLVTNSLFRKEFFILIEIVKRNGEISSNTNNHAITLNRISPIN